MRKESSTISVTGLLFPALKSLPIAALLLLGTTACSDENIPDDNGTQGVESTITVGNDPAAQAHRITFYGNPETRADGDGDGLDFPNVGSEPTNLDYSQMTELTENSNLAGLADNTNYCLKYDFTTNSNQIYVPANSTVYINKTLTINNDGALFKGDGKIYIVGEGKLVIKNKLQLGDNGNQIELYAYENSIIDIPGELLINGKFLSKGVVSVGKTCNVEGNSVLIAKDLTVEGQFQVKSDGKAKATCISVQADGDRAVDLSGGGELAIRSHLYCDGLYLGNNAFVYLWPNAMAEVDGKTTMTSNIGGFYYYSSEGKTGHALLNTEEFHVEGSADNPEFIGGLFNKELKLKYVDLTNCQSDYANKFIASADDYYIPKYGCNPGNGKADEGKPFDPIAIIDGPTHEHNHLSATCIQPVGNLAYVSFHLNEAYKDNADYASISKHMGCVEVYNVTESKAEISSWLMNQDFDFNHLLVDGNKLYTVGDTKRFGATLGVVNLNNGTFGNYEIGTNGRDAVMKYYNLDKKAAEDAHLGSSGNCIIRVGDNLLIASYNCFQSLTADDKLTQNSLIPTTGSAKHIAKGGDKIVTLNLDEKGVESSTGTITVYSPWGTKTASFKTSAITPIDGKNVIATDGVSIYVALGENGVAKYSMNGTLEGSYSWIAEKLKSNPNYKGKPCANGLAIDDNYVYVANGGAGMIVLNKTNIKRVARYSHGHGENEDKYYSANYVQIVGNLIYIAYGRNGLEIVKMQDNTAKPEEVNIEEE